MISTVTTSTVTTLTNAGLAGTLGLIALVLLVVLTVQKEVSSVAEGRRPVRLSKALNVAIVPLVLVFIAMLIAQILGFFQ